MARNCIIINVDRCSGCFGCEVACKMENGVALGQRYNRVYTVGPVGEYPNMTRYALPTMCQQCANAACVDICPTGASFRDENGKVDIDASKCIGCQLCMTACPYGARSLNVEANVVEKCNLCPHLTDEGKVPACVKSCATGARFYGDLDDPESDVCKELAKYAAEDIHTLKDNGADPSTHYIMTSMIGTWYPDVTPRGGRQTAAFPTEE